MESSKRILEAILRIHEAPLTADGWNRTLPLIAGVVRSDLAVMLVKDGLSGRNDRVAGFRSAPDHLSAFADAVERRSIPNWILSVPVGGVIRSSSMMSDREFAQSTFYNEIVRPRGTFYGLVVKPMDGPRHRVFLTAGRRLGRDDFNELDVNAMQTLMPHIITALQVGKRLAGLDLRAKAASDAIDRLDTGVILVDADATVLFANRMAEEQLARSDALDVKDGRLILCSASVNEGLRRAISDCTTISSKLFRSKHVIEAPRGDGRLPLRLTVSPLRPDAVEAALPALGHAFPGALIVIADPEKDRAVWKMRLRHEYGLTAAEAELAMEIMKGDGRDAAAARLGITVATVRTHLLHIFDKTGVRRQAELVHLLLGRSPVAITEELAETSFGPGKAYEGPSGASGQPLQP